MLTVDLDTLTVTNRAVGENDGGYRVCLETVRDLREWYGGKDKMVFEGETEEQALLEGKKLLGDMRDIS